MKILIVEDDELKRKRLQTFVADLEFSVDVTYARSYKSGLLSLIKDVFHLAILDMTLPTYDVEPGHDGGRPMSLGGRELLRQIKRRSINLSAVIVTGFDTFGEGVEIFTLSQLVEDLNRDFSDNYLGCVYFDGTTDEWEDQLKGYLEHARLEKR